MIHKMQVEQAKSLYKHAHRAAEFAHAGWLIRKSFYRFWFPLASNEEFEQFMAVYNAQYEQAIVRMKQLCNTYEKLAAQLEK